MNDDKPHHLLEISRGYSEVTVNSRIFYFKHPTNTHFLETQEYYYNRLQSARKKGIQDEKKLLENAVKYGKWSRAKEEKISSLEWTIAKSLSAAEKITDEIQKTAFLKNLDSLKKELNDLSDERGKITKLSAENWAHQQRLFHVAENQVFLDEKFSKRVGDDFKHITELIISIQMKIIELSEKKNLLQAAFDPCFFEIYSLQYRNPLGIFNTSFFEITLFQRHLLTYASILLNKMKNIQMPDDVMQDPMKIFHYSQQEGKTGAKVSHGIEDLKNKAKNKGSIKAEDFLA